MRLLNCVCMCIEALGNVGEHLRVSQLMAASGAALAHQMGALLTYALLPSPLAALAHLFG